MLEKKLKDTNLLQPVESDEDDIPEVAKPSPLKEAALHGLLGRIVRALEPTTEANTAAILATGLALFGNVIDRFPHTTIGNSDHGTNLYIGVVGDTGTGRKGTSWDVQKDYWIFADSDWYKYRIRKGADSGEGLIAAVQDPISSEDGAEIDWENSELQIERRLVLYESEFSSVFQSMKRSGNKLSQVIRDAYDRVVLSQIIKNKKETVVATENHISGIFHITPEELELVMDTNSIFNGLANRIIWIWSERSKTINDLLGKIPIDGGLAMELREAVEFAKSQHYMEYTQEYQDLWKIVRPSYLDNKDKGIMGKIYSRAEVQVGRLALCYALLDKSPVIDGVHLKAALALWEYSRQSIKYIFRGRIENQLSDQLLQFLVDQGDWIKKTDLYKAIGNHKSRNQMNNALDSLMQLNLIETEKHSNNGSKPSTYYRAIRGS